MKDKPGWKHLAPGDCLRCQNDWQNKVGRGSRNSIDYCGKRHFCPDGECEDFQAAQGLDKKLPWSKRTELICWWLADRVRFGTLDVVIQRMALANPD